MNSTYMTIGGHTKTAGLLGYPVGHTKSPLIHNTLAQYYGDDLRYLPFEVAPEKLEDAVKGAAALGITGLNVTVPHKSAVIPFLLDTDPMAKAIGAVNTLAAVYSDEFKESPESTGNVNAGSGMTEQKAGQGIVSGIGMHYDRRHVTGYKGYNTDILGLAEAMRRESFDIAGKNILILGAGGAARAVAFLCVSEGAARITIANRSVEKAGLLRDDIIRMTNSENRADIILKGTCEIGKTIIDVIGLCDLLEHIKMAGDADVCIQCTSVGLYPDVDDCVLGGRLEEAFDHIKSGVDLIYKPEKTVFIKNLEKRGKKTMNGLSMLLYQGVIAYEIFTGRWNRAIQTDDEVLEDIFMRMRNG